MYTTAHSIVESSLALVGGAAVAATTRNGRLRPDELLPTTMYSTERCAEIVVQIAVAFLQ